MTPGGWSPNSTDVHQEGMIFPHIKLVDGGQINQTMMTFILKNVRFPDLVEGDLNAMIASCRTGVRRVQALCDRYSAETVQQAMESVFDASERMMRRKIAEIPDGEYHAQVHLDHDGVKFDQHRKIAVTVRVQGETLEVDWTGTDRSAEGPINNPLIGTIALVQTAIKALTMPLDPMNEGHLRPIRVTAPEDTIVSPTYPAPCDSYGYAAEMVIHLVVRALSQAIPHLTPACSYQMFGIYFYRPDPRHGKPFIYVDPVDGGGGALPFADGPSGLIFVGDGDAPNTPIEIIEHRYPLRVTRYAINPEGAGKGQYRGGFGTIRDFEVLEDHVLIQTMNENTFDPPWGLFGGESSGISRIHVWEGTEREQILTTRVAYFGPLHSGDRVSVRATGGGGWGDPRLRDRRHIEEDIRNGLLTREQAQQDYPEQMGTGQ
jgi:N-methylhydantoinase B